MSDYYVINALDELDDVSAARAMREVSAFVAELRAHPYRWSDVEFELLREAMVRHIAGDPFSRVFLAWARSLEMQREMAVIVAAEGLQ